MGSGKVFGPLVSDATSRVRIIFEPAGKCVISDAWAAALVQCLVVMKAGAATDCQIVCNYGAAEGAGSGDRGIVPERVDCADELTVSRIGDLVTGSDTDNGHICGKAALIVVRTATHGDVAVDATIKAITIPIYCDP
jgi:hypothetical protein